MSWQPAAPLLLLPLRWNLQTATKLAGAVQTLTVLLGEPHHEKKELSGSKEGTDEACPSRLEEACLLPLRGRKKEKVIYQPSGKEAGLMDGCCAERQPHKEEGRAHVHGPHAHIASIYPC